MAKEEPLYLGFDLSTQQLKVCAVNGSLQVIYESSINFDRDLPHYGTGGGAIRDKDGVTVTAPTLMWVEAVDRLLDRMKEEAFPFSNVVGLSGAAQQHGSVFWAKGATTILRSLASDKSMLPQMIDAFSTTSSPIWMDGSTERECDEITQLLGGAQGVATVSGSSAYCRFTGNQIRKIVTNQPQVYDDCERISLVSSFLASLFLGFYAPIDVSDASGMNLMNIQTRQWHAPLINATGPGLEEKLGPIGSPGSVIGVVQPYFQRKYGFNDSCNLVIFTGDNPASLAGLRLQSGDLAISLGTSDTVFLALSPLPLPGPEGHVMCSPVDPMGYMGMLCYSNGSLVRDHVMQTCGTWEKFNQLLASTNPGNEGNIGLYYYSKEIIPTGAQGIYRFDCDNNPVDRFEAAVEARAVLESQMIAKRLHAIKLGANVASQGRIIATGGASSNHFILQVISDVFGLPVYTYDQPGSAAVGAAYIAYWQGKDSFFESTMSAPAPILTVSPNTLAHHIYTSTMLDRYAHLEACLPR